MTEGNGGELKPAGRFERIERSLERIENKLDLKADQIDLDHLLARVELLERQRIEGVAMGQPLIEQFKIMIRDVEDLKTQSKVTNAVAQAIERMAGETQGTRKWLIALAFSSLITLLAGSGTLLKFILHM